MEELKMGKDNKSRTYQIKAYKPYVVKAEDVNGEKGIVTVAVNGIGVKDMQGDISMPGSFTKTLKENMLRLKWLKDHDPTMQIGVPISGQEKDGNLVMTGQLFVNTQIGHDTLEKYKVNADLGHTMEHSIGCTAIKRDEVDRSKVLEWKLWEYSTLDFYGANPQTFLIDIKSAPAQQVRQAIDFLQKALHGYNFTDETYKKYDMNLSMMLKAMEGGNIVDCPCCGAEFDYDSQEEHTFSQQVMDSAMMYARWLLDNAVYDEMQKLEPEIRQQVAEVISSVKSAKGEITKKSITDCMSYVYCPYCGCRVYKFNALMRDKTEPEETEEEPSDDTPDESQVKVDEKAADGTFDIKSLNSVFNPINK